jgi:hypothetical protein
MLILCVAIVSSRDYRIATIAATSLLHASGCAQETATNR